MHLAKGLIDEIFIQGYRAAHVSCPPTLIPAPGQYLLAQADSDPGSPLPYPVFASEVTSRGFYAAAPLPPGWLPGTSLNLRGPLGHGFDLPASARKLALLEVDRHNAGLFGLLEPALKRSMEITIVTQSSYPDLPASIEILPAEGLAEAARWADLVAASLSREHLPALKQQLPRETLAYAQALIHTNMPCGALAECGICAVHHARGWLLACKDGPVFPLNQLS